MKALHLFLLLGGAAALAGIFAPSRQTAEAVPPVTGNARHQTTAVATGQQDQWFAGEVRLPRQPDGHFYADAAIDGQATRMLVDTGASVVALTGEDAQSVGLNWDPNDVRPVARGASGVVHGVPVTLQHISLDGLEARNVQAIIVPDGLGTSLLGQSFLSRIGRVEIHDGTMVLGG